MTPEEMKQAKEEILAELKAQETATPAPEPSKEIRDKQDFIEKIVEVTLKANEEKYKNLDTKKLAIQKNDSPVDKNVKLRKMLAAMFDRDKNEYAVAASYGLKDADTREFSTTDASGGYSIPPDVRTDILQTVLNTGVTRRNANILPTKADSIQLNGLLTGVTAAWGSEATAVSGTSGTQEAPSIDIGKIIAVLGPFSNEILGDAAPGFYNSWIQALGSQIAQLEDYSFFLGDGTATYNSITGVFNSTALSQGVTIKSLSDASVGATVNLINVLRESTTEMPVHLRGGAKWYFHRTLESYVYNARGTTGEPLYLPGSASGLPTLMGYPVELVEVLPNVSDVGATTTFAAFGNLKQTVHLGDRESMTMFVGREGTVDSKSMFAADQMAVRVTERLGGVVYVPRYHKFGGTNNVERKGLVLVQTL